MIPHPKRSPQHLALVVVLLLATLAVAGTPAQDPLDRLLPAAAQAPGWSRDGAPQEFAGKDLYTYMDGGADIYHEYGFVRAIVQDYANGQSKSVSLEIFEMETPAAAFGMFTMKRSGKGEALGLGSGGELEDYYLNFWKGRYLVTMTGFDGAAETLAGLRTIAAAVESRIAENAGAPGLVAALPGPGLVAGSVKFVRGPLGLSNLDVFRLSGGLDFEAAVKGDYEDGSCLLVLDYGSAAKLAGEWTKLQAELEGSPKFRVQAPADQAVFQDDKGRFLAFAPSGSRLLVGIGPSAKSAKARTAGPS